MADDYVAANYAEIVTKFLLSTYRVQPTRHDVVAALWSWKISDKSWPGQPEIDIIPLISGSSAEFYIKPMLSCLGDIDIMYHTNTELAIPAGCSAPIQLPGEFYSRVKVVEITDNPFPGYVYLKFRYWLLETNDSDRYDAMLLDNSNRLLFGNFRAADEEINGPAVTVHAADFIPHSYDRVCCIHCLHWPTQAADWPTRHREYEWPDSATVDHVISNGCDVVQVAHPLCRQDEWESKYQWRLSFSRAEIVLLNSWTPVQQIVYHMLRIFVKTRPLTYTTVDKRTKKISNYCIKTLMLWACEVKPRNWWMSNTNVVRICVELLLVLKIWQTDGRRKHYFINNCNLLDNAVSKELIPEQLMTVSESWLSTWFVKNYIQKCAQQCPDHVLRLFGDVSTSEKLQTAVSAVVECRRNATLFDLFVAHNSAEYHMTEFMSPTPIRMRVHTCYYLLKETANIGLQIFDYATAVSFLHICMKLTKRDFNTESLDALTMICGQFIGRRRYPSTFSSVALLSQATKLMKIAVNNPRSTVQLIEIELSKAYLYRALSCKESDNDSIYCMANVYLAILYYITGQHQRAIDHCTLVARSQLGLHYSSHVVQGELLPKIDDNIDNALGLVLFYQYVRAAALSQQRQAKHVNVFTTELFAHHLLIRCLPVAKCDQFAQTLSMIQLQRYRKHIIDRQELLIGDLLLFNSANSARIWPRFFIHEKSLVYQRQRPTINSTETDTSKLFELLQQSAVEHLTIYRQFMARKFSSVATIVTTDFEAICAYKRGDYRLCLELSTQNVRTLSSAREVLDLNANVFLLPEFNQLLDDDIVSLTALTVIVNSHCRDEDSSSVCITQHILSLYLMTQCQLKLHVSATQLSQTLGYVIDSQRNYPGRCTLRQLTLKLIRHKALLYLKTAVKC